jgi:flagellar biosynthesis anti-sigma factor FlgM
MRIDLNPSGAEALHSTNRAPSDSRSAAASARQTASSSDRAELSTDQAKVSALASQVSSMPEIRQEKVTELAAAVRNGSYDVSPEQTADAMVSEMLGNAA